MSNFINHLLKRFDSFVLHLTAFAFFPKNKGASIPTTLAPNSAFRGAISSTNNTMQRRGCSTARPSLPPPHTAECGNIILALCRRGKLECLKPEREHRGILPLDGILPGLPSLGLVPAFVFDILMVLGLVEESDQIETNLFMLYWAGSTPLYPSLIKNSYYGTI